ncbi:copper resistance CopC family protein [Cellulomonas sp. URHE0023]|uniref:copper resistance CopC family protein n=1 Tax=Cellulomonas sp. URHE0023 TaxID=1380354 RepID=UPI00068B0216|nr:copper resistance CopC family protein [Cellulomonas sp. URHE0023]
MTVPGSVQAQPGRRARFGVPRRSTAVALTGLMVGGVLGVVGASSAQAHDVLRSSDPADGSTVQTAPEQVTLTFDEPAIALGTEVEVRSPDGTLASDGDPVLVDVTVAQKLGGELPAGRYTVSWRVTSADGHPITGDLTFTATTATTLGDTTRPSPPGAEAQDSGGGSGAPVVVLVVIAAVTTSWLLWRRRRPRDVPGG